MSTILALAVPLILAFVGICAAVKGVDAFRTMSKGVLEGLKTVKDMFPALLVLFPAIYMLRASGALDAFTDFLRPFFGLLGIPSEVAPLALLRPVSGGAATAAAADIIHSAGADSLVGRTAAVMMGSSETTLYVIAVYFGAAKIKDTRHAIPAALCADAAVFLVSAWICRLLYG
ncbi:MAG: spore maturation protein [Bacillota bacterium]|nr:spore maturation protein [Bacillota bacterium]